MITYKKTNNKGVAIFGILFTFVTFSAALMFMLNMTMLTNEQSDVQKIQNTKQKMYIIAHTLKTRVADPDNDGMKEPLNNNPPHETLPADMPFRLDEWGTPIKYCAWDLGNATNTNPTYAQNRTTPPKQNFNLIMKLISAGRNKSFETKCNDTDIYGDDIVIEIFHDEV